MTEQALDINEELKKIVCRFAPRSGPAPVLRPETRLVDDVGIDSPRMVDIVLDIEDRFGITVEDEQIQKVKTFGDLVALVQARSGAD
jgi:acyl carrier protein